VALYHGVVLDCSLLKLSPDIITLPCEGLAATASQTDVAAGDTSGDAEQHTHAASDARSSGDSSSSHGAAASKDILAGRRCVAPHQAT